MVRDVEELEPTPAGKLCSDDEAYLEKHGVGPLVSGLLADVMRLAPPDPLQYMIDALTLGAAAAQQDPELGLPCHRREKLERVFASIDSAGTGRLSLRSLQAYANAHGGETLTNADARAIFGDFKPGAGELVGLGQFLAFFAHASRTMGNASFDAMVGEMGAR